MWLIILFRRGDDQAIKPYFSSISKTDILTHLMFEKYDDKSVYIGRDCF